MSPTRFYETTLLSYAQLEQLAILPNGKVAKTPKWALKKQKQLRRGRDTHRAVTMRAYASGDDLLELFRIFVDSKINQQEIS